MFEVVEMAPSDAILGLSEAFLKDPNPAKINLSVGVYKDGQGQTPIFKSVRQAQQRILELEQSKAYRPIEGAPEYGQAVGRLLFGPDHEIVTNHRAATAHTPGGTGALRVAGEYLKINHPHTSVWVSDPTWANHTNIFRAAGLKVKHYPYLDSATNELAFEKMMTVIDQIPAGDVVLLHGCCHNPTGIDPTQQQWSQIADRIALRGVLPLIDFAYQGFAVGLQEDAAGWNQLCERKCDMIVCSSFSKNFGLYNERVGAMTVVGASQTVVDAVMSQVKVCIRCNYSNPPAHGGAIVTTVLGDASLYAMWENELKQMRDRICAMRKLFVEKLEEHGVIGEYSFMKRQRGMFSFSGLTPGQVRALREKHSIYIVGSGRINVAGMTEGNIDRFCRAIAQVVSHG